MLGNSTTPAAGREYQKASVSATRKPVALRQVWER